MKRIFHRALPILLTAAILLAGTGVFSSAPNDTLLSAAALAEPPAFAPQTEANNLIGKAVTGYQAWFGRGWYHNWGNTAEGQNVFFEMWPATDDYPADSLWQARFGKLNNGENAMLFDSTDEGVIDTHFRWMKEYGIDGAAIQRFYGYGADNYSERYAYLKTIMEKAEKYDRIFYPMYDMSGTGSKNTAVLLSRMKNDFVNNIEGQGLMSSPACAHADGKPVVCLWGLSGAEDSNMLSYDAAKQLIEWFKGRGYYVIVGTPDNEFASVTDQYAEIYAAADMLSPWYVGRYNVNSLGTLQRFLRTDKAYCDEHDIDFLPTIFPGFSWVNLKHVENYNEISRSAGEFLWRQAFLLANNGCQTVYFSMFDEYDEATALMKAATDWSELPAGNQYFLTLAADGYWLSDDYYLRLAGDVAAMLDAVNAGEIDPLTMSFSPDTPYSEGPLYYRNSFESKEVTVGEETVVVRVDPAVFDETNPIVRRGSENVEAPMPYVKKDAALATTGEWVGEFGGSVNITTGDKAVAHRLLSPTKFTLAADTVLSYKLRANDVAGQGVYLNLQFSDESLLSDRMISVTDTGAKTGEWVTVNVPISNKFVGKQVTGVVVSFAGTENGTFSASLEDVLIQTGEAGIGDFEPTPPPAEYTMGDVDNSDTVDSSDARMVLQYAVGKLGDDDIIVEAADVNHDDSIDSSDARMILQYTVGKLTELA